MTLNKPDILEIIERHVILKQKGIRHWGLCPFHDEKTPSMMVDVQRQTFTCFGCWAGGDVVTFIQKLHGVDFRVALKLLDIHGKPYSPNPVLQKQKELVKNYRQQLRAYEDRLCEFLRTLTECKLQIRTEADIDAIAPFFHDEAYVAHMLDLLQFGSEQDRLEIYKQGGIFE
ncbi:CHC2 zinc finger domain-containing protein [Candidatus Magnetominusculus dajiuhuensis]|uniref:CHC2 zinc finger domain-containing protein n=1 Tax=Candidatus Magnetominusculus dajiuhuensis TaxID=3137712 RepID=UPI003B427CF7